MEDNAGRWLPDDGCLDAVFNALDMHKEVPHVKRFGLGMIVLAVLVVECEMSTLLQKRIIGLFLKETCGKNGEHAATCLRGLARLGQDNKQNMDEILARDGIRIVLDAMRVHQYIENLQCNAIAVLRRMTAQQSSASHFIQSNGLGVLLNVMSIHSKHKIVQTQVCSFLAELSYCDENISAIFRASAIPQILQAMSTFPDEEAIQCSGCLLIAPMGTLFPDLDTHMVVNQVLAAMHRFKQNHLIQEHGCSCMPFICKDRSFAMVSNRGVEAVFDVFDRFFANADMCSAACLALEGLVTHEIEVDAGKCIDMACRAMEAHPMKAFLQTCCAGSVVQLFNRNQQERRLCCVRCSKCVLTAIINHKRDIMPLTHLLEAASAIALMTSGCDPHATRQLFNTSIVDLCFEALTLHNGGEERSESAVFLMLTTLVNNDAANMDYIIKLGAMKRILDLGGKHPRSGHMLLAFIRKASAHNTQTCQLLARLGATEQLYKVERVCTMMPEHNEMLQGTIESLKKGGAENCAKIQACERRKVKQHSTVCTVCGKNALQVGREVLLKCACTIAPLYCSTECQHAHWAAHKKECKANRVKK